MWRLNHRTPDRYSIINVNVKITTRANLNLNVASRKTSTSTTTLPCHNLNLKVEVEVEVALRLNPWLRMSACSWRASLIRSCPSGFAKLCCWEANGERSVVQKKPYFDMQSHNSEVWRGTLRTASFGWAVALLALLRLSWFGAFHVVFWDMAACRIRHNLELKFCLEKAFKIAPRAPPKATSQRPQIFFTKERVLNQ